jgi:hypothetical protein
MDITNIIDVELVTRGCQGCCFSTIMVYDNKQGTLVMNVAKSKAQDVHESIKNAWEGYQARLVGRFAQDGQSGRLVMQIKSLHSHYLLLHMLLLYRCDLVQHFSAYDDVKERGRASWLYVV